MLRFADCTPIMFYDPHSHVIALTHAGWRGTVLGIAQATVRSMIDAFSSDPSQIIAGIGPAIGPCCFAVGNDVAERFHSQFPEAGLFVKKSETGFVVNLSEANRLQLISRGCSEDHIETSGLCTACRSDMFFSHRREQGETGRFGLLAGLTA